MNSSSTRTKNPVGAPKQWTDYRIQQELLALVALWDARGNPTNSFPPQSFFQEQEQNRLYMAATRSKLGINGWARMLDRPIGRPGPRRG